MAHFYGTVEGGRGEASRLGHKATGLHTTAASYSGAVQVSLVHRDGKDIAIVSLKPWQGVGVSRVLYEGPVDGSEAV
jgi:hypothetical protein